MHLKGKIACITGAGRGIGRATARLLASHGANLVIVSRTLSEIQETESLIQAEYPETQCVTLCADVSKEDDVDRVFEALQDRFSRIDILVNNAASVLVQKFDEIQLIDWDRVMNVNVRGVFLCSRRAFSLMKEHGGSIVNLGSLAGIRGTEKFPGLSAYIVSKHAIVGFTESLSVEGRQYGIRVNCVAPGAVDTKMLQEAAPFLNTETQPEDIAKSILYFCDETQSAQISGAILEIHSNA